MRLQQVLMSTRMLLLDDRKFRTSTPASSCGTCLYEEPGDFPERGPKLLPTAIARAAILAQV